MQGIWLKFFLILFFLGMVNASTQQHSAGFVSQKKKFRLPFTLVNNLIVIPAELNDRHKINLVLDTGSPYTVMLDFEYLEALTVNKGQQITIGGLGHGFTFQAYDSRFNLLEIGKATRHDTHLIIILDSELHLTKFLGMPVHGIIGYDLMKDFVVEVNYKTRMLTFYQHSYFDKIKHRKLNRFDTFPIQFHQKKPYIQGKVVSEGNTVHAENLLVDTGGWDAIWWFENSVPELKVPQKRIRDTLGIGINGPITGLITRTDGFHLKNFYFERPITSFPDSVSLANAVTFEGRNGSIGGEILHRFRIFFDYKNLTLMLRPNKDFETDMHYNMSGIKLHKPFTLLPWLEVSSVRFDSPAYHAGIKRGDLLTRVNGENVAEGDLGKITNLFKSAPGKKITVSLLRNGNSVFKSFVLKDEL